MLKLVSLFQPESKVESQSISNLNNPKNHGISKLVGTGDPITLRKTKSVTPLFWRVQSLILRESFFFGGDQSTESIAIDLCSALPLVGFSAGGLLIFNIFPTNSFPEKCIISKIGR